MPHPYAHQFPAPSTAHPSGRVPKLPTPFDDPIAFPKEFPAFVPPPPPKAVNLNLPLHAVMPDDWIEEAGHIVFHTVGDTGGRHSTHIQEAIAHQMEEQVDTASEENKPAFFYNLGDVVYFNGESRFYRWQFYESYKYYAPYIFAIPGNHDGDPPDSEPTLTGFMKNFCDEQPRHLFPYRETMTQPYVYWTLEAPFVTIIGLYSNVDGTLDGRGSVEQQSWLQDQLRNAPQDKCLIVAVHHPPYSLDGWHSGSPDILLALDRAIANSERAPAAVFAGHVHSYQRFTRRRDGRETPFLVAGAGGYAHEPERMHKLQVKDDGSPIETPFQTAEEGVVLESYNDKDPGFLRVTIDDQTLAAEYFSVPFEGPPRTELYDSFSLNWKTHKINSS